MILLSRQISGQFVIYTTFSLKNVSNSTSSVQLFGYHKTSCLESYLPSIIYFLYLILHFHVFFESMIGFSVCWCACVPVRQYYAMLNRDTTIFDNIIHLLFSRDIPLLLLFFLLYVLLNSFISNVHDGFCICMNSIWFTGKCNNLG